MGESIIAKYRKSKEVLEYETALKEKGERPPGGLDVALATEEGKKKYLALIFRIAAGAMGPGFAAVVGSAAQTATGKGH